MKRICCPTCGSPLKSSAVPVEGLLTMKMGGTTRRMVEALVAAYPKSVPFNRLVDAMYGDDPAGGPENPRTDIAVLASKLRPRLQVFGWTIPRLPPNGSCMPQPRRLVPIEIPDVGRT